MSEKFGLDWQEYDVVRMSSFLHIMQFEGEKSRKDQKSNGPKNKQFRKRG